MVTLPTFLPVAEAARKYGLEEARLRQWIEKGKIRAGVVAGEMVVSEDEVRVEAIQEKGLRKEDLPEYQKHAHLKGCSIGFTEAVDKYKINLSTLQRWYKKGLIAEVKRERGLGGEKIFLDEADLAYCVEVYRAKGGRGKWLFDKQGLPYQPKGKYSIY
ncbi:hypothetical protein BECAL_03452 [Bellilinea caldifistulae]|uniref:Helix-turn-helix domain-containing protein n=1 Tax=Bellilinea caldifistulae TaxID=360411 RepID=A0A0P6X4N9_9CHLR|nr:hypothetical protein AC812_04945 [Bellilinea caldifistulae]GAP12248.1 hypothetical protein BECAL_03452 [Bellilinea caldifistulae]